MSLKNQQPTRNSKPKATAIVIEAFDKPKTASCAKPKSKSLCKKGVALLVTYLRDSNEVTENGKRLLNVALELLA